MRSFAEADWFPLSNLSLSDLPDWGEFSCACALRHGETEEVLYIGGTGQFRRRLVANYLGGVGGTTTQRIHSYLFQSGFIALVEVAWFPAKNQSAAEKELKEQYRTAYDLPLPPWNRR